jgi:hypothetical protein
MCANLQDKINTSTVKPHLSSRVEMKPVFCCVISDFTPTALQMSSSTSCEHLRKSVPMNTIASCSTSTPPSSSSCTSSGFTSPYPSCTLWDILLHQPLVSLALLSVVGMMLVYIHRGIGKLNHGLLDADAEQY